MWQCGCYVIYYYLELFPNKMLNKILYLHLNHNPISFPGVGKCPMIPKGRRGTRNLERRGSVAYFSSLSQDTGVSSYFSSRLPLWAAIFYTKLHAWTPKGNHTTLPGINATERCQTCDRVIFTSYLWTIIQPSIKTAIPDPLESTIGWISLWIIGRHQLWFQIRIWNVQITCLIFCL